MIIEKVENILNATENIIGHQVNCQSVMGSGLAKQLKDKYHNLFLEYKLFCDSNDTVPLNMLGQTQFVNVGEDKYVANMFGQYTYGYEKGKVYTNYEALEKCLISLKENALLNNYSVALPYQLGSGLAGGNWEKVYDIIDRVFEGYKVSIYKLPNL